MTNIEWRLAHCSTGSQRTIDYVILEGAFFCGMVNQRRARTSVQVIRRPTSQWYFARLLIESCNAYDAGSAA